MSGRPSTGDFLEEACLSRQGIVLHWMEHASAWARVLTFLAGIISNWYISQIVLDVLDMSKSIILMASCGIERHDSLPKPSTSRFVFFVEARCQLSNKLPAPWLSRRGRIKMGQKASVSTALIWPLSSLDMCPVPTADIPLDRCRYVRPLIHKYSHMQCTEALHHFAWLVHH